MSSDQLFSRFRRNKSGEDATKTKEDLQKDKQERDTVTSAVETRLAASTRSVRGKLEQLSWKGKAKVSAAVTSPIFNLTLWAEIEIGSVEGRISVSSNASTPMDDPSATNKQDESLLSELVEDDPDAGSSKRRGRLVRRFNQSVNDTLHRLESTSMCMQQLKINGDVGCRIYFLVPMPGLFINVKFTIDLSVSVESVVQAFSARGLSVAQLQATETAAVAATAPAAATATTGLFAQFASLRLGGSKSKIATTQPAADAGLTTSASDGFDVTKKAPRVQRQLLIALTAAQLRFLSMRWSGTIRVEISFPFLVLWVETSVEISESRAQITPAPAGAASVAGAASATSDAQDDVDEDADLLADDDSTAATSPASTDAAPSAVAADVMAAATSPLSAPVIHSGLRRSVDRLERLLVLYKQHFKAVSLGASFSLNIGGFGGLVELTVRRKFQHTV
ncbi:hypothetical protein CAOG_08966 [Capsaspora owczarzaki ATCC 30864]|uniref:Uncharacterized protein n=1 Tax=Capsaspora owczarzaki (strain ATCC 30864) TaxID=595528 RepID=A0A0D2UL63_CAPO3|nr:hypothetical protein CAOG_08966 [Capsaspora owczarzaki ATCC 30864]KJE95836.1 hypothetical protein CAOG_008966 [Capsaspora owczarzaki ATCC 30864]|eukprot:XP_011270644.1 hypothetical protein CAOG_08966 [Capsaspora owczarzaki ATCC 30864]